MISSLVNWNGPTENIWSINQCPLIGQGDNDSLPLCKKSCLETTGCTAFAYKKGSLCTFWSCTQPVPYPTSLTEGYNGYYFDKGIIKEYQ